ncbi:hypothetical protein [Streptomyces sp. NPDC005423]|uniref:hypothetical protein n=1 Tax=Streptomyces sp. NPDC005423 TaxID=3155343 RepID=UPI0033A8103C
MTDIKNVVILGDSMSDIGNKWLWPSGELGRLFGAMRVNETGRFSDGKNWTDFLVEWATGETLMWGNRDLTIRKSTDYRTLTRNSVLGIESLDQPLAAKSRMTVEEFLQQNSAKQSAPPSKELKYVNYSMGGCIVTTDWTWAPKFGALTYLRGQVEDYVAQRRALGGSFAGPTLHVIWIGLNDFVTAARPDYDGATVKSLPATNSYAAWQTWSERNPKDLENGVGAYPAVAETKALIELINSSFPGAKADNHFMVIDLPSVYNAIRYMEGLGEPKKVAQAKNIDPVIRRYNALLESLVEEWPDNPHAPAADHVHLVRMSAWMDHVSEHLEDWGLSKKAQDTGVAPFYAPGIPPAPAKDPVPADMRRRITTSDLGHPTEIVYSIMARYFVTRLLNTYTLGRLTPGVWRPNAPFKGLPFDVPS